MTGQQLIDRLMALTPEQRALKVVTSSDFTFDEVSDVEVQDYVEGSYIAIIF